MSLGHDKISLYELKEIKLGICLTFQPVVKITEASDQARLIFNEMLGYNVELPHTGSFLHVRNFIQCVEFLSDVHHDFAISVYNVKEFNYSTNNINALSMPRKKF